MDLFEAVIDQTRPTLDLAVFDKHGSKYEMKPSIKEWIKDIVGEIESEIVKINDYFIKGSILSFQWLDHTDVDLLLEAPKMSEEDRDRLQDEIDDKYEALSIPGTEHPLQIYLNAGPYDHDNADGLYYLDDRGWEKGPYNLRIDVKDYMNKFGKIVSSIDMTTGELKRDIIDYELIKKLPSDEVNHLASELQSKLDEINDNIENIVFQFKHLRDMRHTAFSDDMSPNDIIKYGSKNKLPENVIWKLLERYHYVKVMRDIKELAGDDQEIEDHEIDDVKSRLSDI